MQFDISEPFAASPNVVSVFLISKKPLFHLEFATYESIASAYDHNYNNLLFIKHRCMCTITSQGIQGVVHVISLSKSVRLFLFQGRQFETAL